MKKSRFTEAQVVSILKQVEGGRRKKKGVESLLGSYFVIKANL